MWRLLCNSHDGGIPSSWDAVQVILPQLWDAAVDMFDASRAGVISDRKRAKKVQEKVCASDRDRA